MSFANPFMDPRVPPGIIISDDCDSNISSVTATAIEHVMDLLQAGQDALSDPDDRLFRFFFKKEEKTWVRRAFGRLQRLAQRKTEQTFWFQCGPFLGTYCSGTESARMMMPEDPWNWYPRGKIPKNNYAILCEGYTEDPVVTPDPCSKADLQWEYPLWKSLVLLHEMFHTPYLLGSKVWVIRDITHNLTEVHALTAPDQFGLNITISDQGGMADPPLLPTWSVANYVLFAKWAWMKQQQATKGGCPGMTEPLWGALDDEAPNEKVELRKLLGSPESPPATTNYVYGDLLYVDANIEKPIDSTNFSAFDNVTFSSFNISNSTWSMAHGFNVTSAWKASTNQSTTNVTISWNS